MMIRQHTYENVQGFFRCWKEDTWKAAEQRFRIHELFSSFVFALVGNGVRILRRTLDLNKYN